MRNHDDPFRRIATATELSYLKPGDVVDLKPLTKRSELVIVDHMEGPVCVTRELTRLEWLRYKIGVGSKLARFKDAIEVLWYVRIPDALKAAIRRFTKT